MLALAIHESQAQDGKFTHNLQHAETVARLFVGVAWIVTILLEVVCERNHVTFVMICQSAVKLNKYPD